VALHSCNGQDYIRSFEEAEKEQIEEQQVAEQQILMLPSMPG
jgi:hypothetical protein